MAANVLKSEQAVAVSLHVVRTFVKLRELMSTSKELAAKFADFVFKQVVERFNEEAGFFQLVHFFHLVVVRLNSHGVVVAGAVAAFRGTTTPQPCPRLPSY